MTYAIKILLYGLSGAGKTTLGRMICRRFFRSYGELEREVTEEEKKAWGKENLEKISTTAYPNNGEFILGYNLEKNQYYINESDDDTIVNKIVVSVVDPIGQEKYYESRKSSSFGADGIIFIIDASLQATNENILRIINAYNDLRNFYQGGIFPSLIIALNKQDLKTKTLSEFMKEWEWIKSGEKGRKQTFFQTILCDRLDDFKEFGFVGTSALLGWGIGTLIDTLFKCIFSTTLKRVKEAVFDKEPNILILKGDSS